MFARVKKSGRNQYLQLVENRKEKGKVKQRVIATVGRMDQLQEKGRIETLIRSLSRFSEKALLVLSGQSDVAVEAKTMGPTLIFERLWRQSGIADCLQSLVAERKFEFDVERAVFMTVVNRLLVSGSDRFCERWRRDYFLPGCEHLELHHLYRAMGFLGEELSDQTDATPFTPRRTKDRIEEMLFARNRDLFSELELVFFDTTSIYFEGSGGAHFGRRGFSKDHRPDLFQMVVGAVLDGNGRPICCEMWPGNTADVTTLLPVVERIRKRFGVGNFCVVADRGMISAETLKRLEEANIGYILGCRMRKVKDIQTEVLTRAGRYREVYPENADPGNPAPLKVKEVRHEGKRYIVCVNGRQARKDAADRQAIVDGFAAAVEERRQVPGGKQGLPEVPEDRERQRRTIDAEKIKADAVYDGKWVLVTNTGLSGRTNRSQVQGTLAGGARVPGCEIASGNPAGFPPERCPHRRPRVLQLSGTGTAKGAGPASFGCRSPLSSGCISSRISRHSSRSSLKRDGKRFAVRSECKGNCGKIFQAVGVALPPTIRAVE